MHAHSLEHHNGTKVDFKVKILGTCIGDPLLRQCMEAVAIRDDKPSMNRKEEWGTSKNNNNKITTKKQQNETTGTTFQTPRPDDRKNNKESAPKPTTVKPKIRNPATINKTASRRSEDITIQKSIEEEKQKEFNNNTVCWKCRLVCKSNRGLKIHQHACLQKPASCTSFFRDERLQLNQRRAERKEFCGIKVLPPSQPLDPMTSDNEDAQCDVK